MKRTSRMALLAAVFCLIFGTASWKILGDHTAGPFDRAYAEQYINSGIKSFEDRETSTLVAMIDPNANFFQRNGDQVRAVIRQAMDELGRSKLQVSMSNLVVEPGESQARADFDIRISENTEKTDVLYYKFHVRIRVVRQKLHYLLGLASRDVWIITEAGGDTDLQLPFIDHD